MQRSNLHPMLGSSSIFRVRIPWTRVGQRFYQENGQQLTQVGVGFSLITAEDRLTIMNVPEQTSITFFLPHSGASSYTAIVSMTIVCAEFLAHIQYLESKHQGGVCYGY